MESQELSFHIITRYVRHTQTERLIVSADKDNRFAYCGLSNDVFSNKDIDSNGVMINA